MLAQHQLQAVLTGTAQLSDLSPALRSAIRLPIYRLACEVLAEPTREARRARLERVPVSVREAVEVEAFRVFHMRRSGNSRGER